MWTNVLNAHRIHNIYVNTRTLTNENCTFTDGSLRFFRSLSLPFSPLHIHGLHVSKAKIYAPCLFCCFHSLFFFFYCYLFLGSYNFCIFFFLLFFCCCFWFTREQLFIRCLFASSLAATAEQKIWIFSVYENFFHPILFLCLINYAFGDGTLFCINFSVFLFFYIFSIIFSWRI